MPWREHECAFAAYPRLPLVPRLDRRALLSGLSQELRVSAGRRQGGVAYRLADLGVAPDGDLASVRPRLVEGYTLSDGHGFTWAVHTVHGGRIKICPSNPEAGHVVRAFDGTATLGDVARTLGELTGWDARTSFAYSRGVFLHLVTLGVGVPS
jgi:hypothetical protein